MKYTIAVIRGDGIGPEIVDGACRVLDAVAKKFGHTFVYRDALMGGAALDAAGIPLPQETVDICRAADGVLLGAVGGPKWDSAAPELRPEAGLLALRKALGLYANLRPATVYDCLMEASPLKCKILRRGVDIMVVRELTGGIYFGERGGDDMRAYDTEAYSRGEIERIARKAFDVAMLRGRRVVSVDKANVLASSKLWRKVVREVAADYPDVTLTHMYVDNAAMQLALDPAQFDVIVTANMFGDILSDLAGAVTGSIGMLASASLSESGLGLYEPIHGSAPDLAGRDAANPCAAILSAAMLLRLSLGLTKEADAVEAAVRRVLEQGVRTADIATTTTDTAAEDIAVEGETVVGCGEMARRIAEEI